MSITESINIAIFSDLDIIKLVLINLIFEKNIMEIVCLRFQLSSSWCFAVVALFAGFGAFVFAQAPLSSCWIREGQISLNLF